jgi:hypothetical protein
MKRIHYILTVAFFGLCLMAYAGKDSSSQEKSSEQVLEDIDTESEESSEYVFEDMDTECDQDTFSLKDRIWQVYYSTDGESLKICELDEGEVVAENSISYRDFCDANISYISMIDEKTGYLLCCGTPGMGQMEKFLFKTNDGWNTYEMVADLSEAIGNYPTDIAFAAEDYGIITVNYHGYDTYAYFTKDGGINWSDLIVDNFKTDYLYTEGEEINWDGAQWEIALSLHKDNDIIYTNYTSDDGKIWSLKE